MRENGRHATLVIDAALRPTLREPNEQACRPHATGLYLQETFRTD